MTNPSGAKGSRLPCRFHPMARTDRQVRQRRRSRHNTAKKFDVALTRRIGVGVTMRHRVSVADLEDPRTARPGQKPGPARLNEIEMTGLPFSGKSARQNEGRRHPVAGQRLKARRHSAVRNSALRAAVKRVELISLAPLDTTP